LLLPLETTAFQSHNRIGKNVENTEKCVEWRKGDLSLGSRAGNLQVFLSLDKQITWLLVAPLSLYR